MTQREGPSLLFSCVCLWPINHCQFDVISLRSRRLEVVGERENWRARGRHARHTNGRVPVGLLAQIWSFEPERLGKRLKARQIDHKCVNFVVSACANRLGILCPQLCNFVFKLCVAGRVYGTSKSMKSATSSLQSRRFDSEVTDVYILHLLC